VKARRALEDAGCDGTEDGVAQDHKQGGGFAAVVGESIDILVVGRWIRPWALSLRGRMPTDCGYIAKRPGKTLAGVPAPVDSIGRIIPSEL
jgi:hypothetical protein